eukprot:354654-Chlamydomonas_euryale.AAC.10
MRSSDVRAHGASATQRAPWPPASSAFSTPSSWSALGGGRFGLVISSTNGRPSPSMRTSASSRPPAWRRVPSHAHGGEGVAQHGAWWV